MNAGFAYRAVVGADAAGRPLLDHLAERYPHSTRDAWRARIGAGRVLVDGREAEPEAILRAGQVVVWNRPPWVEPAAPLAWALLHRDDDLLAAAKPAGLPTLPGGGFLDHTLLALVRRRFPEAAPLHRLDRGASGIVLFARTPRAAGVLGRAFRDGGIAKSYRALVAGTPPVDAFVVETPIGRVRHPRLGHAFAALPDGAPPAGRPARTEVEVLERRGGTTLVAARPITGRPHQIRIHLAAAGWPLAGDPLYGPGGRPRAEAEAAGACGYLLHADRVEFDHPAGGRRMLVECPPPAALRAAPAAIRRPARAAGR